MSQALNMELPENRGARPKYGHTVLSLGDHFTFRGDEGSAERVRGAARKWGKRHGARFTIRRIKVGTYGCWRIA